MYPRVKNWSYNRLTKPHEVDKIIEIVNPEIVSIESNNDGKLIRPDGSNDKISFKKPVKKLEEKGKGKRRRRTTSASAGVPCWQLILKIRMKRVIMKNLKNQEKDLHKDY